MSELTPSESDLVLGRQNLTPANAAILGGLAGVKQRLASESIAQRLQALNNAVQYGDGGIDLLIKSLSDPSKKISRLSCKLLCDRFGYEFLYARLEEQDKHKLNITLASDPECQPELLTKLARYNDLQILKNLASNPNTPSGILYKLGDMRNFDFLSKTNIEDFKKWNKIARVEPFCYSPKSNNRPSLNINLEEHYNWLINAGIPDEIVRIVRIICEIYQNVTKNPNAPISTILFLGYSLQSDFIKNPAWYKCVNHESHIMHHCPVQLQIAIAKNIDTRLEGLICLWCHCHSSVDQYIVAHPNISIEMLEHVFEYIQDGWKQKGFYPYDPIDLEMRNGYRYHPSHLHETPIAIAKNTKTPSHILEKLAIYREEITDERIKLELGRAIAEHPDNPK